MGPGASSRAAAVLVSTCVAAVCVAWLQCAVCSAMALFLVQCVALGRAARAVSRRLRWCFVLRQLQKVGIKKPHRFSPLWHNSPTILFTAG